MAVKANDTHDLSFLTQADTPVEIGLMLAEDKNGFKIYEEGDDSNLASQYYSGEPSYANLPPEKEFQIAQFDFTAGIGQEVFDPYDPKRYWDSSDMDLRFKGGVILSPTLDDTVVIPSGIVRAWSNFNDDLYIASDDRLCRLNGVGTEFGTVKEFTDKNITNLKEYTDGNLYIALGGSNKYYYMPAELVVENCEAAWDELTEADVTPSRDSTAGYVMNGSYSAKFIVGAGLNAGELIATHDMTSVDLSSYTDTVLWVYSSVTLAANDLQLIFDDTAECAGTPVKAVNIPAVTADTWTSCPISLGDASGMTAIISIGLKMVVDKNAFNLWVDDVRVADFTESAQSDGKADFFKTVGATFWKAVKSNELKSSSTPESGWSTATTVGSTSCDITALLEESGQLFVIKEDMPYYLDIDGNVCQLIPDLKNLEATTNGVNSIVWNKKLYIPWGSQSLIEYNSGEIHWRDPSLFCTNLSPYGRKIRALASDERYLFAKVGGSGQVLAGREEEIDGINRWVWHFLTNGSGFEGGNMFVSSVYKKRLYATKSVAITRVYYCPLPTNYSDVDADTNYVFDTTGYFITPWYSANLRGDSKAFIKITLHMEDTTDAEYFEAHYRIQGQTAWTDIGDFKTSPTTTTYLPVDVTDGEEPVGKMIQFKFVAITGDTSTTPKLFGFDCRGIWYPTKRKIIACRVKCADNLTKKSGGVDTTTAATIKAAIEEARDDATWPITFYDIYGSTVYVKILSARFRHVEVDKDKNKGYVFDMVLMKQLTHAS